MAEHYEYLTFSYNICIVQLEPSRWSARDEEATMFRILNKIFPWAAGACLLNAIIIFLFVNSLSDLLQQVNMSTFSTFVISMSSLAVMLLIWHGYTRIRMEYYKTGVVLIACGLALSTILWLCTNEYILDSHPVFVLWIFCAVMSLPFICYLYSDHEQITRHYYGKH